MVNLEKSVQRHIFPHYLDIILLKLEEMIYALFDFFFNEIIKLHNIV